MARARGSVSIGTPNAFAAIGGDVTVGRPDPASGEDIGAAGARLDNFGKFPFAAIGRPLRAGWTIQAAEITNRWAQPPDLPK